MSTLRTPLKLYDFVVDKAKPEKTYLVLHEELHDLWLIDDKGEEPPFTVPKRMINMAYTKVDPKVIKILYGNKEEK